MLYPLFYVCIAHLVDEMSERLIFLYHVQPEKLFLIKLLQRYKMIKNSYNLKH